MQTAPEDSNPGAAPAEESAGTQTDEPLAEEPLAEEPLAEEPGPSQDQATTTSSTEDPDQVQEQEEQPQEEAEAAVQEGEAAPQDEQAPVEQEGPAAAAHVSAAAAAKTADLGATATPLDQTVHAGKHLHHMRQRRKKQRISATNALDFVWAFGYSTGCPNTVHYLGTEKRDTIFYTSGHTGIIFDRSDNDQKVLQGHRNSITAACASPDKRWVATADAGDDCMIVVWDAESGTPTRTYFQDQGVGAGASALAFSHDGMFLISASTASPPEIAVWDWTSQSSERALVRTKLEADAVSGTIVSLHAHPDNPRHVVANSEASVVFLEWDFGSDTIRVIRPTIPPPARGSYTQSVYLPHADRAIVGTKDGHILVFEEGATKLRAGPMAFLKKIKVSSAAVSYVGLTPDFKFVVAGGLDGAVRFFDHNIRSVGWHNQLDLGPISSVSFSADSEHVATIPLHRLTPETFGEVVSEH
jgi:WD40 repeat protein